MAKSFSPKALKGETLLNLCKGLSVVLKNDINQQFKPIDGNLANKPIATMAHVTNVRTSERLKEKFKNSHETLELLNKDSKEQTQSYVKEDLFEINNRELKAIPFAVLKFKPHEKQDSSSSDDEFDKLHAQTRCKITKKTPRIVLQLPDVEKNAVKAFKKRNVQFKSLNSSDKVSKANTPRTRSSARPLKEITTNITNENISNVLTKKNSTKTGEESPSSSLSKDKEDSTKAPKRLSCKRCDKSFQYASALKAHKLSHAGLKPYTCAHCSTSFSQKSHLRRHLLIHEKSAKKFKCTSCEMSFLQKSYLLVHTRVHSGAKPYICDKCGKPFSQKSHLNTHMKSHEEQKGYSCAVCHKSFTLPHHLSTHIQNVHKNDKK